MNMKMLTAGAAMSAMSVFAGNATLDTETLALEFSLENGSLVSMTAKSTGWRIQRRPELGMSWKLIVPMDDDHRDNPIFGVGQKRPEFESGDGFVRFTWNGVTSERTGDLDIRIVQEIRAEESHAVWRTRIDNNSPHVVESVYAPVIGDLGRPADAKRLQLLQPGYGQAGEIDLWPHFAGHQGDYGCEHPTITRLGTTACEPFVFIHDDGQGLYLGTMRRTEDTLTWFCELFPGYDDSLYGHVPDGDEIGGKPVHTVVHTVHQPYVMPGESEDLAPIMLEAYRGGWEAGADVYKGWIGGFSKDAPAPAWISEPNAWLELHINSPEDELRWRYSELPEIAAECAGYGVKAIQLIGWNNGGQDQGNPSHDTDPRLGTREELAAAIAEAEKLGVKIIIFSKFTWADRAERWYRDELVKYAVKDPYGDAYFKGGYKYFTPAQFLDINTKNFSVMCFGCDEYLDICDREFDKVLGLGAVGILYDECAFRLPALACFDMSHGHRYGWPVYRNDNLLIERFRRHDGVTDDFLFAGEGCNDWQFEQYNLSYFRTRVAGHIPMQRYLRPRVQLMVGIQGFNDRNMVNQCLLNRYIMSYEPYNFHGRLRDFPLTLEYGRRMDAFRTELRKWLWDGDFTGRIGIEVSGLADGAYSRFAAGDGSAMGVIANFSREDAVVEASLDGRPVAEYRAVEDGDWTKAEGGRIPLKAMSAVAAR